MTEAEKALEALLQAALKYSDHIDGDWVSDHGKTLGAAASRYRAAIAPKPDEPKEPATIFSVLVEIRDLLVRAAEEREK